MEKLLKQIKKAAELRLMELDITEYMTELERQYGATAVKQVIERLGFQSVLGNMYR